MKHLLICLLFFASSSAKSQNAVKIGDTLYFVETVGMDIHPNPPRRVFLGVVIDVSKTSCRFHTLSIDPMKPNGHTSEPGWRGDSGWIPKERTFYTWTHLIDYLIGNLP